MDHSHDYARLSSDVRRCWTRLAGVTESLSNLRKGELAAQCFDLELQLSKLAEELLDLSAKPYRRPSLEDRAHSARQLEIPF